MLLEISLVMAVVILMLRFSPRWIGFIQKAAQSSQQKALTQSLDWDRPSENKKLRKPNAIIRFWRG